MRVLPTIWVHMWTVSQVLSHSRKGRAGQSVEFKLHLVDITPAPVLARLERFHDGVVGTVEMFGRVAVLRGIAATHVPADHAQAQVNPAIAGLQTVFAAPAVRLHVANLVRVRALHSAFLPQAGCEAVSGSAQSSIRRH